MHCCENMNFFLKENKVAIYYSSKERKYGLDLKYVEAIQSIFFCPWCGKKLPKNLSTEWFEELEKLGIDEPFDEKQQKKIPSEFLTDEWWKKRGL